MSNLLEKQTGDFLEIEVGTLKKLLSSFPHSFINQRLEFIAEPKKNQYFLLEHCDDTLVRCKVLEYLSRSASFALPYKTEKRNAEYQDNLRHCINNFLGTEFSREDMELIYIVLGNAVRHSLTVEFVQSGYDMMLLKESRG